MDYERLFSDDVFAFLKTSVRGILKNVNLANIYSFAGGHPNSETFPVDDVKRLNAFVLDHYGAKALQYNNSKGVSELISAISARYGVEEKNIQITTSSQQGIDVCTRILINPGDIVLTTQPTYYGALQSFKSYRAEVVGLEGFTESTCGVDTQILAKAKLLYIIPDFQNPSGETLSLKQREEIIELSKKYGFIIIEDAPYRELRYEGETIPSIYSIAPERTLHLGSFSKIFAPGFRVGWIFGPEAILNQIYTCKQSIDLCSPVLDQFIIAEYLTQGVLDEVLPKTIAYYRRRRDKILSLLEKYMPSEVTWTRPQGGLFIFATLPQATDTMAMYEDALANEVAYVAGSFFYIDGSHRNTMRLNFSFISDEKMEDGVRILSKVIKHNIPQVYKYSGAGNDFIVLQESKNGQWKSYRKADTIQALCSREIGYKASDDRIGADGLMILSTECDSSNIDFKMEYYNSDGSGGMMCGNGGRCIVAFANEIGLKPKNGQYFVFEAADGLHTGEILSKTECRISMIDAFDLQQYEDGWFINTGTRHFVKFVEDVEAIDIISLGQNLRYDHRFSPQGANINFVQVLNANELKIRTYEKGVEAETLACGTGIVASAIAHYYESNCKEIKLHYRLKARSGDILSVDFSSTQKPKVAAENVYLSGPVELI